MLKWEADALAHMTSGGALVLRAATCDLAHHCRKRFVAMASRALGRRIAFFEVRITCWRGKHADDDLRGFGPRAEVIDVQ